MKIRVIWNVILCYLKIRKTLPKDFIRSRIEQENNDPLIDISYCSEFFFKENIPFPVMIRKGTYNILLSATQKLPEGMHFKIYDAYRSAEEQKDRWKKRLQETRKEHPNTSHTELIRLTRLKVAQPDGSGYGGHQTGGAVDITICDQSGHELDMGGQISFFDKRSETSNKYITPLQLKNRMLLKNVLENAGFKNYPREWWHYSYGDKMWAAYSFKKKAFYGFIEPSSIGTE